ncbi:MAG: ABC transporter ATP-binding protein [Bacteroidales bacterium]|uniref:ABC transporter ATP-binding protein n=1 Tax=Porphyromonas sp. TaxID=1924944 RepID=UPI00297376D8|nr:ABC transporter ATP-binding protein [Porphyromonas sp.]MDD7437601.1 ABC transporter ATP-binding protein [Bacteroidales bacterium]MDY3067037.1 ABC transporter ATP-binding protein [Porphyromonas sp.]
MERKKLIEVNDVHKSFGSLEILKGITMEVYEGEIVAIVGASGAGKTTLLQILGTLDGLDKGCVTIGGIEVHHLKEEQQSDFRNQKMGFVFQSHQLLPEFTAEENVAIPAMIGGKGKKEALASARDLLRQLGMGERLIHKPAQLSGGEKQRVAVARALINSPLLILADEPTGALDSDNRKDLHKIFKQLNEERGQTFLIVSHDPEISQVAHRTIRLEDGIIKE